MKSQLQDNNQVFSNQLFKQIEHLPLLLRKCEQLQREQIHLKDIQAFIQDIETLLVTTSSQLEKDYDHLSKEQNTHDF
jgi:hypothetical protein